MDISVTQQTLVFAGSLALGCVLGLFYDFFRMLRLAARWNGFWIFLQDLIFWICSGCLVFAYVAVTNLGELRWYILFGALCGGVLYFLTLGAWLMQRARRVIAVGKRFLAAILKLVSAPILLLRAMFRGKKTLRRRNLKNIRRISKKYFQIDAKRDRMVRSKGVPKPNDG